MERGVESPTHRGPLLARIRREAPGICAKARRESCPQLFEDLDDGLALEERLPGEGHGDLSEDAPHPAAPDSPELHSLITAWLSSHPDRRRAGAYLTPRRAARSLLRAVSEDFHPRAICDPAVGAGVFLEEALRCFGSDVEVWGIDSDPVAVALSRLAVWLAGRQNDPGPIARRIRVADFLLDPDPFRRALPPGGFDLICGNPPFGNAIERRTARTRPERKALRDRFPETARGPYDRSLLFVDLATRLLSPEGRYALLLPRALMAARYAAGLRGRLSRVAPIEKIVRFERDAPVPECEIFMVGWIGSRCREVTRLVTVERAVPGRNEAEDGVRAGEERENPPRARDVWVAGGRGAEILSVPREALRPETWGILLEPAGERIERSASGHPCFGDFFEVSASASVAEAYTIRSALREALDLEETGRSWRFLTVRLISRYRSRWGSMEARFLGRRLRSPVLPKNASGLKPRRAARYDRPKIVVAGLSRLVKAVCDATGEIAGSVGTLSAVPLGAACDGRADALALLRRGTLLLNSDWITAIHRARRGAVALAGGSIPLLKGDLADLPCPRALVGGSSALGEGGLSELLSREAAPLPRDPELLAGILDAAAAALLGGADPEPAGMRRWDLLVQRVIESLAAAEKGE
jgi:predicted RNA methylase